MKSQLFNVRCGSIFRNTLVILCFVVLALPSPAPAATITGFVETPNSLSFNFSGLGFDDFISSFLPPLTNWILISEAHSQNGATGKYGFAFFNLQHIPGGPVLAGLGDSTSSTLYGNTLTDTKTLVHGTGLDTYFVSITVNASPTGSGEWGAFSGSVSANHTTGVPEGGSTGMMVGLAFLLLTGARRLYRTAA